MREQLFDVMMCGPFGYTYELTLKHPGLGSEYPSASPVTIRTDESSVVFDLVFEHVHCQYRKIVREKIKNLMDEPVYIGFIDELKTPFGDIAFRSSKAEKICYEILVDGERAYTSAVYHTALAVYVKELYTLVNLNVSAQIRHLVEWL